MERQYRSLRATAGQIPIIRNALIESDQAGGDAWPGATLPDIGQLTAQASRIAGDVGDITQRIGQAFDSTALKNMQQSVKDLAAISGRLVSFANAQTDRIDHVSRNVATTSDAFAGVARTFQGAVARLDTATSDNQLKDILDNSRELERRPATRGRGPYARSSARPAPTRRAWCGSSRRPTR